MSAIVAYQRRSDGNWYSGCTCKGLSPENRVSVPDGSVELIFSIQSVTLMYGPVTGIEYRIQPYLTIIDIDSRDETAFRTLGVANTAPPTTRGVLGRTGKILEAVNGQTQAVEV